MPSKILVQISFALLILVLLAGCEKPAAPVMAMVGEVAPPPGVGARFPHLASGDGGKTVLMSWLQPAAHEADSMALLWSRFDGTTWSEPEQVTARDSFFINWADFPSIVAAGEAPIAAHWLQKVPGSTYAYHVNMAFRDENGTWGPAITPHADRSAGEHGFVSLLPIDSSRVFAVWLDGYQSKAAGHGEGHHGTASERGVLETAMTLHSALVHDDGTVGEELEIDASVCDCCQTSAARSGDRVIVVYRNRTAGEIRDIYSASYSLETGAWSEPQPLSNEGWEIAGCPVNGPQVAAAGDVVIAGWYSEAGGEGRSYAAVSTDGGLTFSDPQALDSGPTIGRVGVAAKDERRALVTWIGAAGDPAIVHGRLWNGATLGEPFEIGQIDGSRASGFPRAVAQGDGFLVAWTEPGDEHRVRTVKVSVEGP